MPRALWRPRVRAAAAVGRRRGARDLGLAERERERPRARGALRVRRAGRACGEPAASARAEAFDLGGRSDRARPSVAEAPLVAHPRAEAAPARRSRWNERRNRDGSGAPPGPARRCDRLLPAHVHRRGSGAQRPERAEGRRSRALPAQACAGDARATRAAVTGGAGSGVGDSRAGGEARAGRRAARAEDQAALSHTSPSPSTGSGSKSSATRNSPSRSRSYSAFPSSAANSRSRASRNSITVLAGHQAFSKGFYAGFPDAAHHIETVIATQDSVVVRFVLRGTHRRG